VDKDCSLHIIWVHPGLVWIYTHCRLAMGGALGLLKASARGG